MALPEKLRSLADRIEAGDQFGGLDGVLREAADALEAAEARAHDGPCAWGSDWLLSRAEAAERMWQAALVVLRQYPLTNSPASIRELRAAHTEYTGRRVAENAAELPDVLYPSKLRESWKEPLRGSLLRRYKRPDTDGKDEATLPREISAPSNTSRKDWDGGYRCIHGRATKECLFDCYPDSDSANREGE